MPALRTDDGPRKLRAVWLGPKGATLPFEWTYVQWAVVLLLLPVGVLICVILFAGVAYLLTGGTALWFTGFTGTVVGGYGGIYVAVWIMRNVTFDEPLRHKRRVLHDELSRRTRRARPAPIRWQMPFPKITDTPAGLPTSADEPPTEKATPR